MVELAGVFSRLHSFKALVLGDFLLDVYTTGRVKRISPEAPVPVMEVKKQEERPGGAGNVVLNLLALQGTVIAVGRIGDDAPGKKLKNLLKEADTSALLVENGYQTPIKNRLIADSQQLLRIDFETIQQMGGDLEEIFIKQLKKLIPQVQIVAISDYGKGFLTPKVIAAALQICREHSIPSVVDPKGIDFAKYKGASVLKPNLSEAYAAAKCSLQSDLDEVAKRLLPLTDTLLITRSEAGISIFEQEKRFDFPVRFREVKDVTGAGDTVLAIICLGLANGLNIQTAAQLANIAAGLAIERIGCVQITLSELAQRFLDYASETKIFDDGHMFALRQVLQGKSYSLLALGKGQTMTNALFRAIKRLSGLERELIIYVETHEKDEFIQLLASLQEVKSIIFQKSSLKSLCDSIHPHEVYVLREEEAVRLTHAKTALDSLLAMVPPPRQTSPL